MKLKHARAMALGIVGLLSSGLAIISTATPAQADGPGVGPGWVVTVGDSYISGEAGRWAGNTNKSSSIIDAQGAFPAACSASLP